MALTKEERDALPSHDFAVPGKRELPIHDKNHVSMAWKMVDRTKDLTPEERDAARTKILHKAKELGMDTEKWELHAMSFESLEAMAIELPHVEDHPNKTPFSGILTRLDTPSDNPLGSGSNGKRVMMPTAVAEKALPSLLGMAVDFTPNLDGHDKQSKIGLITEATIEGNAIHIKGFFYSSDFPTEVERIQAEKSRMGFSFEAQARIKSMDDDPLVIDSCFFTGAAVLYKDKAAYTTTQLSANSEIKMENDKAVLDLIASLETRLAEVTAKLEASEKDSAKSIAASVGGIVKEHADRLRACAASMMAAGIGGHPTNGHVAHLHRMADGMEADAAQGKMPHVYQTDNFYNASAAKEDEEEKKEMTVLKDAIASFETKLADLKASSFKNAEQPERKTIPAVMSNLLAKANIQPDSNGKFDKDALDAALDKVPGVSRLQAMALKTELRASGQFN